MSCRRKTFQLQLGRLWQEVCPLGWTVTAPQNAHRGEEVRLSCVWAPLHAQRSPDKAHPPPHDHQEDPQLADRGWQTQQNCHSRETQEQQRSEYAHPRAITCLPGLEWRSTFSANFLKIRKSSNGNNRPGNGFCFPRVCAYFSFLQFRSSVDSAMWEIYHISSSLPCLFFSVLGQLQSPALQESRTLWKWFWQ